MTWIERRLVALLRRLGYLVLTPQDLERAREVQAELDMKDGDASAPNYGNDNARLQPGV